MDDARAKQAMYLAKSSAKSSMRRGSGRALMFIIGTVVAVGGAAWIFFSLL